MSKSFRFLTLIAISALVVSPLWAQADGDRKPGVEKTEGKKPAAEKSKVEKKAYVPHVGNTTCPFAAKPVDKKLFAEKKGERVYVADKASLTKAKKDFAAAHAKAYPKDKVVKIESKKCIIMPKRNNKDRFAVTFQGHEINFCCKKCVRRFHKDPQKWLTVAKHPELNYLANEDCPLMSKDTEGLDYFVVYDGYLVNLCCRKCVIRFAKAPERFLKKLGVKRDEKEKSKTASS
jgi:YHS domain-containing protein